jgi:hypothetical protein
VVVQHAAQLPREYFHPRKDERRRAEDDQERDARHFLPRQHSRQLLFEFEIVGDGMYLLCRKAVTRASPGYAVAC